MFVYLVVRSLLLNGEEQDEVSTAGRCRTKALRLLCSLHPPIMTSIQSLAISNRKHPTLALFLALEGANSSTTVSIDKETDCSIQAASTFIPFLYNLIVKGSKETKVWFTQYLKRSQQKVQYMFKPSCLCVIILGCVVSKTIRNCAQFITTVLDQAGIMPLTGQVVKG